MPQKLAPVTEYEYIEKWNSIALSTARIDRESAEKVVNSAYAMLGYKSPTVLFFDSPYAACSFIAGQTEQQLQKLCGSSRKLEFALDEWYKKLIQECSVTVGNISKELYRWESIDGQIGNHIWQQFEQQALAKIQKYLGQKLYTYIRPGKTIVRSVGELDYLVNTFNLSWGRENWSIYKSLIKLSNYIYLHEKACIICDRPTKMSFDSNAFLHAEGEPAIQFADGYCLYSYHLTTLPQKYGEVHPTEWQPKWLLTENNWEVREALVKGIGYKRISCELSVTELDDMYNFLLVSIDMPSNSILVYLLEININDGNINRVREVPSHIKTVNHAACYVDNLEEWNIESSALKKLEIPF
ncbi:MAG: DUF6745 domain-containing protein [Cyanobacteria bacterium P01_A01_bin.83]